MAEFKLEPYVYKASVVRWVDGDTIILKIGLGFHITKTDRFRLFDVNTPERGKDQFDESVQMVNKLAPEGSSVLIMTLKDKQGKYGRYLAIIFSEEAGDKSINDLLIEKGWKYGEKTG